MATKDDDKDLDARDDDDEEEDDSSPPKKTTTATTASKPAADDDDDKDDDDEEGDDDEDDDDPPAKPGAAAKDATASKAAVASAKPVVGASKPKPGAVVAKKVGVPAKGAGPASSKVVKGKLAPTKKKGSLGTSMVLFVIVVGGLAAGFAILGREGGGGPGPAAPKWTVGQEVDVEITLVKTDRRDLGCASPEEVGGRHCAFESKEKRWSKPDKPDDKKAVLQPYTTTNGVQFVAAGLWSDPALETEAKLPATRFTVKCKFKVEGKLKKPAIRWHSDDPWADRTEDWYSGAVNGCSVTP